MFYPDEVVNDLRQSADIVRVVNGYTTLTPKGNYHFGLCPFHQEKSPSFSVTPSKQMYHCFGCGASGNVYTFIMNIERLNFKETIEFLADLIGYKLPTTMENSKQITEKTGLLEIHAVANKLYHDTLFQNDTIALDYLKGRNISEESIEKFSLGFSSRNSTYLFNYLLNQGFDIEMIEKSGLVINGKNGYFDRFFGRVIFPIFDTGGKVIGFGGRALRDDTKVAKYLNSNSTPIFYKDRTLYGLNFAKSSKKNDFLLVEGYLDVIKMHQYGYDNAIASLGTAFNQNHVRTINPYKKDITICFDNDEAGLNATKKAISILEQTNPNTKVLRVNGAKDPDEFLEKFGNEKFNILLDEKMSYIDFLINIEKDKYDLSDTAEKVLFVKSCVEIVSHIQNEITLDAYIKKISKIADISENAILSEVKKSGNIATNDDLLKKPISRAKRIQNSPAFKSKKDLITMLVSNKSVFLLVKDLISSEEFNDKVFEILYDKICDTYQKGLELYPADYLNIFETSDEQSLVSEIFQTSEEFLIDETITRAVTDIVKIIKKDYLSTKLLTAQNEENYEDILSLLAKIKEIDKLILK